MNLLARGVAYLFFVFLHVLQFIIAITVAGLYGVDLHRAAQAGKYSDSKWVYAEVVAGLSAVSAVVLMVPTVMRFALVWAWNMVLFIMWIALFGLFGGLYIHANPQGDSDIQRMKNAVWVDLVGAILWFITSLGSFAYWWGHRERHTRFTGRAKV